MREEIQKEMNDIRSWVKTNQGVGVLIRVRDGRFAPGAERLANSFMFCPEQQSQNSLEKADGDQSRTEDGPDSTHPCCSSANVA